MVVMSYLPQDISARSTTYFPSLIEFASGAGIVAYGLLAFTLGVRFLNVVDHRLAHHHEAQPEAEPTLALSN